MTCMGVNPSLVPCTGVIKRVNTVLDFVTKYPACICLCVSFILVVSFIVCGVVNQHFDHMKAIELQLQQARAEVEEKAAEMKAYVESVNMQKAAVEVQGFNPIQTSDHIAQCMLQMITSKDRKWVIGWHGNFGYRTFVLFSDLLVAIRQYVADNRKNPSGNYKLQDIARVMRLMEEHKFQTDDNYMTAKCAVAMLDGASEGNLLGRNKKF